MSLVGCRQHFRVWLSAVLLAGFTGLAPAQADTVSIRLDQAHIMQLPDRVATIVIGNPLIADATLQGGGVLVVTGKGYGSTNLVALDRAGRVLLSHPCRCWVPARGTWSSSTRALSAKPIAAHRIVSAGLPLATPRPISTPICLKAVRATARRNLWRPSNGFRALAGLAIA